MKYKAILITKNNMERLAGDFGVEDYEGLIDPGYYLVTNFANERWFHVLSKDVIERDFLKTDQKLLHDWFEIETKV